MARSRTADRLGIDFGKFFEKRLRCATGQANVKRYNRHLWDVITRVADPSFLVSHREDLERAPGM